MALWPASGGGKFIEAAIGSQFTKGDVLTYNAASALSRINNVAVGADIAGIAMTDSRNSINNKATYFVPDFDTVLWADVEAGSTATRGARVGFTATNARGHIVASAATTARAVVERGVAEIEGQSVRSRIQIRLISEAGDLAHS